MSGKSIYVTAISLLTLAACHKSDTVDNSAASPIFGTWKYAGMSVAGTTDETYTDQFDTSERIGSFNYTTIDNGGQLTINNQQIAATGINYTIYGARNITSYVNSVHIPSEDLVNDSVWIPVPRYDITKTYIAASDSLRFPKGFIAIEILDAPQVPDSIPVKYRYAVTGDTLFLTTTLSDEATLYDGAITDSKMKMTATIKYVKQ